MRPVPGTVLVVGAGLAGTRCAETLRTEGFEGRIVLLGEESTAPYERPALSKQLLAGAKAPAEILLRPPESWTGLGVELRLGARVAEIDVRSATATLAGGETLSWDALVLATGARPRRLPGSPPEGVHALRTIDDALALRRELLERRRLVVVGAGLVGGEVASTAAALGAEVTLVDRRPPLERLVGPKVASLLAWRARRMGIDLRLGAAVAGLRGSPSGRVRSVLLADGAELPCELVVVAIGAEPARPAHAAGAVSADGVAVDACGRSALPGVFAAGDVAAAWRPSLGRRLRVEHWTSAAGQGAAAARAVLGVEAPYDDPPYFWSDQFGLRLQYVGAATAWRSVELEGGPDAFGARYLDPDGRLVAGLLANRPRGIAALRRELGGAGERLAA